MNTPEVILNKIVNKMEKRRKNCQEWQETINEWKIATFIIFMLFFPFYWFLPPSWLLRKFSIVFYSLSIFLSFISFLLKNKINSLTKTIQEYTQYESSRTID